MEFLADSRPVPHAIPGDAVAILVWEDSDLRPPPRWRLAGIVLGGENMAEARDYAVKTQPDLNGQVVLATKIGGQSGLVEKMARNEAAPRVTVKAEPVPEPEQAGAV